MVDSERLSEWMRIISTTAEEEIDCDVIVDLAAQVAEAATEGADVQALVPLFALHLDHCSDCRDYFETLVAFVNERDA
jgi:predicted anti-sigma-YlaC factor YlaD